MGGQNLHTVLITIAAPKPSTVASVPVKGRLAPNYTSRFLAKYAVLVNQVSEGAITRAGW